jgi:hypothetical protein
MRWRLLPPVALLVVGLAQVGAASLVHLTPWKGGGFGMFSTLDHAAFRGIDIVIEAPDRSETLEIPPSLDLIAERALTCPADWLLGRLAAEVVARERRNGRAVSHVQVTVWTTAFDRVTLAAHKQTIRTFRYTAAT